MIGAGHAIGDTAIIVFLLGDTYMLQGVGNVPLLGTLRGTGSTLTSYIFDNAPTGDLNQPNKAFAAALVLLVHGPDHQRLRRHLWPQGKGAEMDLTLQPPPVRQLEAGSTLTVAPGRSNAHVHGLEELALETTPRS